MKKIMATLFLFGASERGEKGAFVYLSSIEELLHHFGHPPENSEGIPYAIQGLLFKHDLIFFRVEDEGFSTDDYLHGLKLLKQKPPKTRLNAICMPGVGDQTIIQAALPICHMHSSVLVVSEKDLYDYLTAK